MKIDIDRLSKTYRTRGEEEVVALKDVTIKTIESGSFVTIVGPSGCGKTTLLDIVIGVTRPTSGRVDLVPDVGAASRPGIVPQRPVMLDWRTNLHNVVLPAEFGGPNRAALKGRAPYEQRAADLLDLVGLADFKDKYPSEMSGGMQQRVAIARALLLDSSLICMDEPFGALDEFTREQMNLELLRIWAKRRFTGLFVTHNIHEAIFLADRVLVMTPRPGRVVADIEVELERPRDPDVMGSDAFASLIRQVRSALASSGSVADSHA